LHADSPRARVVETLLPMRDGLGGLGAATRQDQPLKTLLIWLLNHSVYDRANLAGPRGGSRGNIERRPEYERNY